jgi:hypothetical protein
MRELLSGQLGPVIGFAFSVFAAWKAANLLDANNQLAAIGVGTACALFGPFLLGDMVTAALANSNPSHDGLAIITAMPSPELMAVGSRLAFALVGVLAWCGVERAG